MRSACLWPAYLSQILSTGLEFQSLMLRWFSDQEHGTGSASLHCLSMAYTFKVFSLWCTFVVTMVAVRQLEENGWGEWWRWPGLKTVWGAFCRLVRLGEMVLGGCWHVLDFWSDCSYQGWKSSGFISQRLMFLFSSWERLIHHLVL